MEKFLYRFAPWLIDPKSGLEQIAQLIVCGAIGGAGFFCLVVAVEIVIKWVH